ncbi:hypothetical protein LA080_004899 [Diaporthe eres]|nr:hypothetical protein LA080_004899 [Diaporthe eres]
MENSGAKYVVRTFILSGQDPPGLVINVKKVSTVEHSGDKLNLLISSEIWESSGFSGMHPITNDSRRASAAVLESLKRFALNFEQFQDISAAFEKSNICQRGKQVLLLWFHHVQLSHTLRSFEEVRWIYQKVREWRVDSGKFKLLPHLLDEVITDAKFFKGLEEAMAENLTSTLEALLGVVGVGFEGNAEFNAVAADLRGLSSDLQRKAGDLPNTLA